MTFLKQNWKKNMIQAGKALICYVFILVFLTMAGIQEGPSLYGGGVGAIAVLYMLYQAGFARGKREVLKIFTGIDEWNSEKVDEFLRLIKNPKETEKLLESEEKVHRIMESLDKK